VVTAGAEIDDEGARRTKFPAMCSRNRDREERRVVAGGVSLTCFVFVPPPVRKLTDPLAEEGVRLRETFERVHEADSAVAQEIAT
jgi:hypothetical protein